MCKEQLLARELKLYFVGLQQCQPIEQNHSLWKMSNCTENTELESRLLIPPPKKIFFEKSWSLDQLSCAKSSLSMKLVYQTHHL